ncbi:unnamed protein product [Sphagnum balticum]
MLEPNLTKVIPSGYLDFAANSMMHIQRLISPDRANLILMVGKSPSGLEMVLKGLDIQLEISTLDSLDAELVLDAMDSLCVESQSKDEDAGLTEMDTTEAAPVARDCTYINKMRS